MEKQNLARGLETRIANKHKRRDHIVACAGKIIAEDGLEAFTIARLAAQVGFLSGGTDGARIYSTVVRHLIALPIALKQRQRGTVDPSEFFWPVLQPSEANAMLRSPCPHLVLLGSLSTLVQPLRAGGDYAAMALWGELERNIAGLQTAS